MNITFGNTIVIYMLLGSLWGVFRLYGKPNKDYFKKIEEIKEQYPVSIAEYIISILEKKWLTIVINCLLFPISIYSYLKDKFE